jgi:hypothetical protein
LCWKISFLLASWRSMAKIAGSGSGSISQRHGSADPDPLVRGMDPRIRIHSKMSWISNTVHNILKSLKRKPKYYLVECHIIRRSWLTSAVWWVHVRNCCPLKTSGNCVICRGKVLTANPKKGVDD